MADNKTKKKKTAAKEEKAAVETGSTLTSSKKKRGTKKGVTKKGFLIRNKKIIKYGLIAILVVGLVYLAYLLIDMEPVNDATFWKMRNTTNIYDKNDNYVTSISSVGTTWVELETIDQDYINAVIATEDNEFYEHRGVNILSLVRATLQTLTGNSSGGSTITMQLAKLLYLQPTTETVCQTNENNEEVCEEVTHDPREDNPIIYKSEQMLYAWIIEWKYTKDEILEYYMNIVYFGNGVYGVENAAQYFFNKSSSDLEVAEAALLAGIPQLPSYNNPYNDMEAAQARFTVVVDSMVSQGYLTEEAAEPVYATNLDDIIVDNPQVNDDQVYSGYVDIVYREMKEEFGEDFDVAGSGAQIYTNMDPAAQQLTWSVLNTDEYVEYDDDQVQAGVVLLDTSTGAVLAVGNGRNHNSTLGTNYAYNYTRQPGSSAKPITAYGPAVEYLGWGTGHMMVDQPISYSDTNIPVENFDNEYEGNMTMEQALTRSRNTTAIYAFQQVADEVGTDGIEEFMKLLGIEDSDNINESYGIGGFDVGTTPYEMAGAYAAFGNGGIYNEPNAIRKVSFPEGTIGYETYGATYTFEHDTHKAMEESTAFIITDMLRTTNAGSHTSKGDVNGYSTYAKTGSSNFADGNDKGIDPSMTKDSWFVGYTAEYTLAVWAGYPHEVESPEMNLGKTPTVAADIWHSIMAGIVGDESKPPYEAPETVIERNGQYYPTGSPDISDGSESSSSDFTIQETTTGLTIVWNYTGDNRDQASWNVYIDNALYQTTTNTSISIPYSAIIKGTCAESYVLGVELVETVDGEKKTMPKSEQTWKTNSEIPGCDNQMAVLSRRYSYTVNVG